MASLKYYNSIVLLFMIIVVYLFSLFSFCYASQIKSLTHHTLDLIKSLTHHTLDLSQHGQLSRCINWSSTTNIPDPGKDSATAVFEVLHNKKLCAYAADGATSSSSSIEKILRRDQLRVKQFRQKIMNTKTNNIHDTDDHSVPVQSGDSLDYGDAYIVRIGLGTPMRNVHLILDTGSFLTWTQCQPCFWNCYNQRDQTFDPRKSTTYSNISCTDRECPQSADFDCYKNHTCEYGVGYNDESYTIGFLAKEKLTLTHNDVFPNFMFGCGQNNSGLFGKTAGLLGLSRGRLSVVAQTAQKYGQYFSYFFPSDVRSSGHLTFGRNINNTRGVKFTSLIYLREYPYYYFIKITSITVACKRLPLHSSVFKNDKNIIDSGTTFTYLAQNAYIAMRDEFKDQMNTKRYPIAPAFNELDTCFYVHNGKNIEFPTITFTFEGDVTVEVGRSGIFSVVNSSVVCLAFASNGGENDSISVFGNMVQQNMEVVYDVAGGKLGFGIPTG